MQYSVLRAGFALPPPQILQPGGRIKGIDRIDRIHRAKKGPPRQPLVDSRVQFMSIFPRARLREYFTLTRFR